jgi:hypothetical protein
MVFAPGTEPKIIVERGGSAAGVLDRAGFVSAAEAGLAIAGRGWPNTMVPLEDDGGSAAAADGFAGAAGGGTGAVGNIIVRPALSSGAGGAAGAGGFCGGFGTVAGAANTMVALDGGCFAGGGGSGGAAGAGAGARVTQKVFWHLPQRMVRPCGPIRLSSTR